MSEANNIKKLSKKLLTKCKRLPGLEADIDSGMGWGSGVNFENDKLKSISSAQRSSISLRVINKKRLAVTGTTLINDEEIDGVFEDAISLSKFGKRVNFSLPGKKKIASKPKTYDASVEKINIDEFVEKGKAIIDRVKEKEPEMKVNSLNFAARSSSSLFFNTNNVSDESKDTGTSFGIEISKIKHGDFFQLYRGQNSVKRDIDYLKITDGLLEQAAWGRRIVKIQPGKYPVVFSPEAVPDLIGFLLTSLNGKIVNEKSSKFVGKLGERLFDTGLSITDNPLADYFPSSYSLDDEGVPAKINKLIKRGYVNKFYYDLNEANEAKTKSTGSGGRSGMFTQATPVTSNIFINSGKKQYKSLIKDIKEGILAYQFLGAGQNNPYNGDFQLGVLMGYKIENGEVVGRVKETSISGNVFELLKDNVLWFSKDKERWGSLESPYICLGNVTVMSK